jgi:hypothetical protein
VQDSNQDVKPLKLPQKKAEILIESINYWKNNAIISENEYTKLLNSFEPIKFDFKKLAKYAFWISLICVCISMFAVISDKKLMELLKKIFNAPIELKFLSLSLFSGLIYFYGMKRNKTHPDTIYKNEAILFIGNIVILWAISFLWDIISPEHNYKMYFAFLCAVIYGVLAYIARSKLTWVITIFFLAIFYGLIGAYLGGGLYLISITSPVNFLLFNLIIISASFLVKEKIFLIEFRSITYKMGLLFLFICLWMLSIFGNYQDIEVWRQVKQIELFHWSILFTLASIGAIYYGLKNDDYTSRSFGIVFLFINLYTRFFEYFWDNSSKAIFFLILAISFWVIGSKAEYIWNVGKKS